MLTYNEISKPITYYESGLLWSENYQPWLAICHPWLRNSLKPSTSYSEIPKPDFSPIWDNVNTVWDDMDYTWDEFSNYLKIPKP